jgi:hypothetical protein
MIYFPMHGLRRYIPLSWRVKRAIKGLDAAARQKRIFHLWFHPTNLADQMEAMFTGLRAILEHARSLRANEELVILPMGSLAPVSALPRFSDEQVEARSPWSAATWRSFHSFWGWRLRTPGAKAGKAVRAYRTPQAVAISTSAHPIENRYSYPNGSSG